MEAKTFTSEKSLLTMKYKKTITKDIPMHHDDYKTITNLHDEELLHLDLI